MTGGYSLGQEPPRKASRERPHSRGRPAWDTVDFPVAGWVSLDGVQLVFAVNLRRGHGTLERRIPYSPPAAGLRPIPLWPAETTHLECSQMTAELQDHGRRVRRGWNRDRASRGRAANGGEGARSGTPAWNRGTRGGGCRRCPCAVSSSMDTGGKESATAPQRKGGRATR